MILYKITLYFKTSASSSVTNSSFTPLSDTNVNELGDFSLIFSILVFG